MLTFGDARKLLAPWADRGGFCSDSEKTRLFVLQVMQYVLWAGGYPTVRKFCFQARKGWFTIPYELETPLKVKIDNRPGTVWDRWFEFYNVNDMEGCIPASDAIYEDANTYPTIYDVSASGARIGCLASACESDSAHLVVKGFDPTGREIITNHAGEQVVGEYLSIKKGVINYSQATFGKITSVEKDETVGYVQLLWVNPTYSTKGFLADYSPLEKNPAYRRYKLKAENCHSCQKVEVLGRIRLKEAYVDNDLIPFENITTLQLAAQAINAHFNAQNPNDVQVAQAKDASMMNVITRESNYKKPNTGQPIEIGYVTSAGSIRNILS